MTDQTPISKSFFSQLISYFLMALGAFLAACSIDIFLIPNNLYDGGIVGVSMIFGSIFGKEFIPVLLILFNLPFLYLAYRSIGKTFLLHMLIANLLFAASLVFVDHYIPFQFYGDTLEVVVIGGAILGVGLGLIIRIGGCLDGTEILGIILNRKVGFTVGQVVLFCNFFIFGAVGLIYQDWHPPILSLITYVIAVKVMDSVIVGLEETKSVTIISHKSKEIADALIHKLGLGLTVMYGRGGFSGADREILYVIAERLQLADLKELVFSIDPMTFIAIENLHEVANGMQGLANRRKKSRVEKIVSEILGRSPNH